MKVLHLLVSGGVGGIEMLMRHYAAGSDHDNCFLFLWGGGEIAAQMQKEGRRVVIMDLEREGGRKTFRKVTALCQKERFDAVVSHNSAPLLKILLLWLKLRCRNLRAFAYAHANARDICADRRKRGLWLRKAVHRAAFRWCDGVIAVSASVKESLTEYLGIPAEKIRVIYNGIPLPEELLPRRENEIPQLLYAGRLTPEKGVQVTLRALKLLAEELEFVFSVAGDGDYRPALEALTEELGLSERVRFLGARCDVPRLLAKTDVFVHAPVWEEGFGISVLEAMAAGCICVCARSGALEELITHGADGFLAEKDSPESLAAMLKDALSGAESDKIRRNAITRARAFSLEAFCGGLDGYLGGTRNES